MKQRLYAGIDLGGTNIKYGLASGDGEIVHSDSVSTGKTRKRIISQFATILRDLEKVAGAQNRHFATVGIGSPGHVDIEQGRVVSGSPNVRQWRGADIRGDLNRELNGELDITIFVDNDANAMALAEHSFGAGSGYSSGLYLTVGTGLGSGLILGKKMWRGATYAGAELGHSIIVKDGYPCQCGKRGCLEMYVNAESFVRFYGARAPQDADSKWVFDRAKRGDPHAISAIRKSADYLACGIGSALEILNPEVVVIGGGVALGGKTYFDAVRRFLRQYASKASYRAARVLPAQLGNYSGVLGAALLPLEHRLL